MTIEAAVRRADAPLGSAVALILFALAVGLAVVGVGVVDGRRRVAASGEVAHRLAQLRLMTSLAPVVQQSMDLGHILPAVAIRLRDELDLAGIGFAVPDSKGELREVFSLGSVESVETTGDFPSSVSTGQSVAVALHRGGRSAGVLRLRAARALNADDLEPLRATAELTTAAIVNTQLFEQQDEALRQLREVDEMKTVFIGTASHELRTPITAISGFAELLAEQWDQFSDEQRRAFAGRIVANASALDSLVQDILDFARLERGRLVVTSQSVDLTLVAASVLERLAVTFATHTLATDLAPTPLVMADASGLERILTNLTSNAVKYSPHGTTVTIRTAPADGGAELTVDDEGPGVPAAERSRIFSRFYRGSGQAVLRTRGTGIGLSVVHELADQMGGEVSVSTAPGGGARFRVWLGSAPVPNQEATS